MKVVNETMFQYLVCYEKEDFSFDGPCKLVDDATSIFSTDEAHNDSYSQESARATTLSDFYNFFESSEGVKIYILYNKFDNKPVSLSINRKLDEDVYLLEYIATNKFERSQGYATELAKYSFADLRNNGIKEVLLVVNNRNFKSQNLQESIARFSGIKVSPKNDGECSHYAYNIESLNENIEDEKYEDVY